ncbi:hypothetical protein PPL_00600 [Heterostelium album PN500]|uniref:Uncharacterized protein n=1 Tax=Heterostelium pallidum (strain ATCC 26659 / Pp 5 / PN500) TaxID=670386 RepID=D3AWX2_HETP5|nr:hypothetical protein PPL_00600 [Heterostelium album PN500]EFA86795.1 hypothetical protein PPL_00600 [Heterostelium album PN500]|eukprot:XP_020438899.1 hypothetical protein PPL_00600 [Heterostelium album PN500]
MGISLQNHFNQWLKYIECQTHHVSQLKGILFDFIQCVNRFGSFLGRPKKFKQNNIFIRDVESIFALFLNIFLLKNHHLIGREPIDKFKSFIDGSLRDRKDIKVIFNEYSPTKFLVLNHNIVVYCIYRLLQRKEYVTEKIIQDKLYREKNRSDYFNIQRDFNLKKSKQLIKKDIEEFMKRNNINNELNNNNNLFKSTTDHMTSQFTTAIMNHFNSHIMLMLNHIMKQLNIFLKEIFNIKNNNHNNSDILRFLSEYHLIGFLSKKQYEELVKTYNRCKTDPAFQHKINQLDWTFESIQYFREYDFQQVSKFQTTSKHRELGLDHLFNRCLKVVMKNKDILDCDLTKSFYLYKFLLEIDKDFKNISNDILNDCSRILERLQRFDIYKDFPTTSHGFYGSDYFTKISKFLHEVDRPFGYFLAMDPQLEEYSYWNIRASENCNSHQPTDEIMLDAPAQSIFDNDTPLITQLKQGFEKRHQFFKSSKAETDFSILYQQLEKLDMPENQYKTQFIEEAIEEFIKHLDNFYDRSTTRNQYMERTELFIQQLNQLINLPVLKHLFINPIDGQPINSNTTPDVLIVTLSPYEVDHEPQTTKPRASKGSATVFLSKEQLMKQDFISFLKEELERGNLDIDQLLARGVLGPSIIPPIQPSEDYLCHGGEAYCVNLLPMLSPLIEPNCPAEERLKSETALNLSALARYMNGHCSFSWTELWPMMVKSIYDIGYVFDPLLERHLLWLLQYQSPPTIILSGKRDLIILSNLIKNHKLPVHVVEQQLWNFKLLVSIGGKVKRIFATNHASSLSPSLTKFFHEAVDGLYPDSMYLSDSDLEIVPYQVVISDKVSDIVAVSDQLPVSGQLIASVSDQISGSNQLSELSNQLSVSDSMIIPDQLSVVSDNESDDTLLSYSDLESSDDSSDSDLVPVQYREYPVYRVRVPDQVANDQAPTVDKPETEKEFLGRKRNLFLQKEKPWIPRKPRSPNVPKIPRHYWKSFEKKLLDYSASYHYSLLPIFKGYELKLLLYKPKDVDQWLNLQKLNKLCGKKLSEVNHYMTDAVTFNYSFKSESTDNTKSSSKLTVNCPVKLKCPVAVDPSPFKNLYLNKQLEYNFDGEKHCKDLKDSVMVLKSKSHRYHTGSSFTNYKRKRNLGPKLLEFENNVPSLKSSKENDILSIQTYEIYIDFRYSHENYSTFAEYKLVRGGPEFTEQHLRSLQRRKIAMNWRNRRIFNHAIMAVDRKIGEEKAKKTGDINDIININNNKNNNISTSKGSSSSIGSSSINSNNRFSILEYEDNNNNDDDDDDDDNDDKKKMKLRGKSYYKYKQQEINYYNFQLALYKLYKLYPNEFLPYPPPQSLPNRKRTHTNKINDQLFPIVEYGRSSGNTDIHELLVDIEEWFRDKFQKANGWEKILGPFLTTKSSKLFSTPSTTTTSTTTTSSATTIPTTITPPTTTSSTTTPTTPTDKSKCANRRHDSVYKDQPLGTVPVFFKSGKVTKTCKLCLDFIDKERKEKKKKEEEEERRKIDEDEEEEEEEEEKQKDRKKGRKWKCKNCGIYNNYYVDEAFQDRDRVWLAHCNNCNEIKSVFYDKEVAERYALRQIFIYGNGPGHLGYVKGMKGVTSAPYISKETESLQKYIFSVAGVKVDLLIVDEYNTSKMFAPKLIENEQIYLMNKSHYEKSKVQNYIKHTSWSPNSQQTESKLRYTRLMYILEDGEAVYINRDVNGAGNILLVGMRQIQDSNNESRFTLLMKKKSESTTGKESVDNYLFADK